MQTDPNTPHGHTAENARLEGRVIVSVTMRDDQMNQMMPNGRGYTGPGPHEFQIYRSDIKHLEALVETQPGLFPVARQMVANKTAEWCRETRRPVEECPINFPAEFRIIAGRDLLPVVSYKEVGALDTIALDAERKRASAISEATSSGSVARDTQLAQIVAQAVASEMAKARGKS